MLPEVRWLLDAPCYEKITFKQGLHSQVSAKPTTLKVLRLPSLHRYIALPQCEIPVPVVHAQIALRQGRKRHLEYSACQGVSSFDVPGGCPVLGGPQAGPFKQHCGRCFQETDEQSAQTRIELQVLHPTLSWLLWVRTTCTATETMPSNLTTQT